jgi:hypothetical protein
MGLQGVLVLDVPPGTPAAKAGLQGITRDDYGRMSIGDVIVGMNGKPVKSEGDLFGTHGVGSVCGVSRASGCLDLVLLACSLRPLHSCSLAAASLHLWLVV